MTTLSEWLAARRNMPTPKRLSSLPSAPTSKAEAPRHPAPPDDPLVLEALENWRVENSNRPRESNPS